MPTYVFPDTNVLLHYPPLADIDWCKTVDAKEVVLVLCLQVIHELDAQKSDPRLASRAVRAIKEIREYSTKPLRQNVTLTIFNQELRSEAFPPTLSPESGDDRIIHLVKQFAQGHASDTILVVTEDYGMELRCQASGTPVRQIDATLRLENPQDEQTKKYKQAVTELNALKNRLPVLSLRAIRQGEQAIPDTPFQKELVASWETLDPAAEIASQKKLHVKHGERGSWMIRPMIQPISQSESERYDNALDAYYLNYDIYIARHNTWAENAAKSIAFDLWLGNTGNAPAQDIDVFVRFPSKIRWLAEVGTARAQPLEQPRPPEPPERPKYTSTLFKMPGIPFVRGLDRFAQDRFEPEPDVSCSVSDAESGIVIHAKVKKLKHGQGIALAAGFVAVYGTWDDVSPFEAEYSISASEIPSKVEGRIPFVVRLKQ